MRSRASGEKDIHQKQELKEAYGWFTDQKSYTKSSEETICAPVAHSGNLKTVV